LESAGDRARRPRRLVDKSERRTLPKRRHFQREIGATDARTLDWRNADEARAFAHGARLEAGNLGLVPPWFALSEHEPATATGQRDKDKGADKIPTHATPHTAENAGNFVNDPSMLPGLPWLMAVALDPPSLLGQITA
jgi:hypothetical protein